MVNRDVKDRIIDFKVDIRMDSDHLPLCLKIREQEEEEENSTTEVKQVERRNNSLGWRFEDN